LKSLITMQKTSKIPALNTFRNDVLAISYASSAYGLDRFEGKGDLEEYSYKLTMFS
jgi:hypothetical protein